MKPFIVSLFLFAATVLEARSPNVVIILADDLGIGDLGSYGAKPSQTPRLDRLAEEGARLTQFQTPAPLCAPTRGALMTGRYPFRCGMNFNPAPDGGAQADALALPKGEITLADVMKTAGYRTALIGKWHLGHREGVLPTDRGFDEYFGIPYSNDMRPVQLLEGRHRVEYPVVQTTLTQRYSLRAERFIQENKARPFFLLLAEAMPHKPLAPSETHYRKSGLGLYAETLRELDDGVGRVLDALEKEGLASDTLVMFSSDNGAWLGGSNGELRGMKGSNWEGGVRVPCLLRWPGKIPAGTVSAGLGVTMDLFATALAATGAAMPDERVVDGRSLLPMLGESKASPHEVVFAQQGAKLSTVRDSQWKLHVMKPRAMDLKKTGQNLWKDFRLPDGVTILAPVEQYNVDAPPGLITGPEAKSMMLFDLLADPGEQKDVAKDFPQVVRRLKTAYDQVNADVPVVEEVRRE
jgi:arylsulfatase A-like enzyme